jgi:hypothetical protein
MMKCGHCEELAAAWVTRPTVRSGTKSTPVCTKHLEEMNHPDNLGDWPRIQYLGQERREAGGCEHPGLFVSSYNTTEWPDGSKTCWCHTCDTNVPITEL